MSKKNRQIQKNKEQKITYKDGFATAGLQEIANAGFLTETDLNKLTDASSGVLESWTHTKIWRSEVDMKYSVLNDTRFPTKGHKYIQSMVEQDVHFRELMYLSSDYQDKQGELMVLEAELEELENEPESKKRDGKIIQKKAAIRRAQWHLMEMQKAAHHRVREVTLWEKIKKELDDGSFDPRDYESILMESYPLRWQRERQAEIQSKNPKGSRLGILGGSLDAVKQSNKTYGRNNTLGKAISKLLGKGHDNT